MHELVGPRLSLTQEFLAQMMGVRRTSVTLTAQAFQKQGLLSYRRGTIQIENPDLLKQSACECHEAIRSHYQRLFSTDKHGVSGVAELT